MYSKWVFKYGVGVLEFIYVRKKVRQIYSYKYIIKSRYKRYDGEIKVYTKHTALIISYFSLK